MPKITDPDDLNQNIEVEFLTGSRLIRLNVVGNITASSDTGVSMQALYSFIKEEWRSDNNLIKFPFPMEAITSEQFEFINGWDLSGSLTDGVSSSKALIRDAGWALKNAAGNSIEEYMNLTSLGSFVTSSDQAYYVQTGSLDAVPTNTIYNAEVNEPILIYTSQSGIVNDYRDYFKIFLREPGKTYASYNLLTEQNLNALTYRKFALPLSNNNDTNIDATDNTIDTTTPYTNMAIYYLTESITKTGFQNGSADFYIVIDGANGTTQQIYEFVQRELRQTVDIDDSGSLVTDVRGEIADQLLEFVGDTLYTKRVILNGTSSGVYVENFLVSETNNYVFTDNNGVEQTYPFVAAGNITFNDNLSSDDSSSYFVFFTNDDAGDNLGYDFGTQNAIIIEDNNSNPLTGSVNGSSSLQFDYDYDNNVQRGNPSSGSDAPFTAVALGLGRAQYVVTTGTLIRSTSNLISFVAALERNYSNN